jgi:RNA polymerase sigma-70 factor (ECF subfamily)
MRDLAPIFVELWTRNQEDVRRYVSMLIPRQGDVDDVMQELAVALLTKFAEYDSALPFLPWANRFAYLEVLKWRQKHARDRLLFSDELLAQLELAIAEETPMLEIRRKALNDCLQKLTPRDRDLILARYAKHGAVQRAAEHKGIPADRLYRLMRKLRCVLLNCVDAALRRQGWPNV